MGRLISLSSEHDPQKYGVLMHKMTIGSSHDGNSNATPKYSAQNMKYDTAISANVCTMTFGPPCCDLSSMTTCEFYTNERRWEHFPHVWIAYVSNEWQTGLMSTSCWQKHTHDLYRTVCNGVTRCVPDKALHEPNLGVVFLSQVSELELRVVELIFTCF